MPDTAPQLQESNGVIGSTDQGCVGSKRGKKHYLASVMLSLLGVHSLKPVLGQPEGLSPVGPA